MVNSREEEKRIVARNKTGWGTLLGILLQPKEESKHLNLVHPRFPGHFSGILVALLIHNFFLNSYIPSLLLPFSVYLHHVNLKQNLRGSGISNKLIHHYIESTRGKGKIGFGGRNLGKFLLFADSKAGIFSCFFVCVAPAIWPDLTLPLPSLLENKLRGLLMSRDRRKL